MVSGFLILPEVTGPEGLKDVERTYAKTEKHDDRRSPDDTKGVNSAATTLEEDVK